MTVPRIELMDSGIRITDLEIPRKDVADFLRGVREENREATLIQALEVGIYCLERSRTNRDTDFVRRQVESLLSRVEEAVGSIPEMTQKALLRKLSTDGGQLLAPLQQLVQEVSTLTNDRIKEVKDLLALEAQRRESGQGDEPSAIADETSYEDTVVAELQDWAQLVGAEIQRTAADDKPGDIVVRLASTSLARTPVTIVLVTRDDQTGLGRRDVTNLLAAAIAERQADASIFLSRTMHGLDQELGEWAEGDCEGGLFVACTHHHLITALRFLIVQRGITSLKQYAPRAHSGSLELHLQRVRGALERVKLINRKVADIRSCSNEIQAEAETLRNEVRGALSRMEDGIRPVAEKRGAAGTGNVFSAA